MFGFHVMLVCMWCAIGSAVARKAGAESGEILDKINSARCTSRCLTLHITQLAASFRNVQSDDVLQWCEDHRRCSQCLQPCKGLWEKRRGTSQKSCEKHHECTASAEFLGSVRAQKQGDCPPPHKASGFAAACVESCSLDRECSGPRKCCPNDCGQTCQAPANLYKGVPLRPRKDMSFLEDQQGQLLLTWTSRFNVSIEPVLYILQKRWNYGIHPSEDEATPWQTVTMTMQDHAVLKDVQPHRWYQFRVSAVNSQGSRGFTTPSKHFFSSRDPFPPERPLHLRVGNFTVQADGTISTLLLWDPPREEDLAVHHYKVTWGAQSTHRKGQDRKGAPKISRGTSRETEIKGLHPDTTYVVQVQAIAQWGQKRLKSSKAQLRFTTAPAAAGLPDGLDPGQATGEVSNELPSSHTALRLEAAAPHYHNSQLQVKVFWKKRLPGSLKDPLTYLLTWSPETCAHNFTKAEHNATLQGTYFVITGLMFACKYRVSVMPVSGPGQRSEAVTSVTTPSCSALRDRGVKSLSCTRGERPSPAKKAQQRPEKLTVAFQMQNSSLQGVFSWQLSQAVPGQDPVTGFQFSWVPVSGAGGTSATLNTPVSQTQFVHPDRHSLTVGHLQPESGYKVQVQVLSAGGSGPSIVKTLHTPRLNSTLL
ncbi:anosmin-1-like [Paramormyrops kingsleyae]|uniref:Anosmin 1b n=1 Tax=Paramormyrops kingsleyae TaxID=1676925 RepID=A0A3B3SLZ4_9TELE|nr:anosmin-1-like [Paramormyrops kingsleyae]